MLDCCEPLHKVKAEGSIFGKVVCLAHCAGAMVQSFRADQTTTHDFRPTSCAPPPPRNAISSHPTTGAPSCKFPACSIARFLKADKYTECIEPALPSPRRRP
ncbi:Glutathione gamma-glutamylcysteinyltransferase 1 [Hordeum vulgare]|nr:Glutathione gamma-glutamylcysteinyltransferase 1 [Hordeum vulgare]